jgi:hypothetical protein
VTNFTDDPVTLDAPRRVVRRGRSDRGNVRVAVVESSPPTVSTEIIR